jgi:soluble lytic murein transglycosylase
MGDAARARSLFDRVRRDFPQSSFAEAGLYQVAQTHYEHGRFADAASAFDRYLSRHGRRGKYGDESFDERAVSWLVSGKPEAAAQSLTELQQAATGLTRARYDQLLAVAWLKAGKRDAAIAGFKAVVQNYPLTFAALAAEARLAALGEAPVELGRATAPAAGPLLPAVPNAARLLHAIGLDAEAEREVAKAESEISRAHPGRGDEALCLAYSELAPKSRAYRVGYRAVTRAELMAPPAVGREWLWDCVYPRPYAPLVAEIGGSVAVEAELIYAIIRQESGFRPDVVSPARAVGLMQLLPSTAGRVAVERGLLNAPDRLTEPPVNIQYGANYLRKLLDLFDGNVALAAASYNAGPSAVLRWLAGAPELELDLFVARIPFDETRAYVERVVGNYARYRYLNGGEAMRTRLSLTLPKTPEVDPATLY